MPADIFMQHQKIIEAYPKLLVDLAFAHSKLKKLGYDFESDDTYNPAYEQEFELIDEAGEVTTLDYNKPKKEDMN